MEKGECSAQNVFRFSESQAAYNWHLSGMSIGNILVITLSPGNKSIHLFPL